MKCKFLKALMDNRGLKGVIRTFSCFRKSFCRTTLAGGSTFKVDKNTRLLQ